MEITTGSSQSASETGLLRQMVDALREAGFAPNQLQGAYDKTELLDKYAKLAQELGRLPTSPELRLKAHSDSGFPSHNTFGRFGSKVELVRQMVEALHGILPAIQPEGISDLSAAELKFSGNAQQRKRDYLLHHGTLLYAFDLTLLVATFARMSDSRRIRYSSPPTFTSVPPYLEKITSSPFLTSSGTSLPSS